MLPSEEVLITRRTLPDGDLAEEIQRLVYFGNTVDAARSRPIDLRSGGTFAGADITIEIGRTLSRKIRGVIVNGITGKPAAGTTIRAISMEASLSRRVSLTVADNEGAFEVSGISPGSYLLFSPYVRDLSAGAAVQPQNPESIAMVTVEAGSSNLENVRLVLLPPVAVPGRVTSEGRPITASDLSRIRVTLSRDITLGIPAIAPPSVASRQGVVDGSGAFALWAPPGNFRVEVQGIPPNTYVKSAFLGGKDVLGGGLKIESSNTNPLEVVLANATAEVSGTVINGRLDPVVNALVVLVPGPTDLRSRADLYITTTTDATGRFRLRAVPPGNYKLFAWNYVEPEIWLNREFLRAHESAGKTIEVGQSVTEGIQVTLTPRAEGVQQ
jgi:hypothetical protein